MKKLGVTQLQRIKHKIYETDGEWKGHLGNIPEGFVGIIYGDRGSGKTEYGIKFAKYLTRFDNVDWLSYEQGHDSDLQDAINRNKMEEVVGKFFVTDPLKKRKKGKTRVEELDDYLGLRNTPKFVFIDSLDYIRMTTEDYFEIKEKYGKRKGLIFLSHANGPEPKSRTGRDIDYDGKFGIFVKKFIAYPRKNRLGGIDEMVISEERARKFNPLYFKKKESEQ